MNGYLVPANAKKGTLLFNFLRPIDMIIEGIGIGITLLALLITASMNNANLTFISFIPMGITSLLVVPIPNYHNVLCTIQSIFRFFSERRNYYWRGWCFYERFAIDDDKKSKK